MSTIETAARTRRVRPLVSPTRRVMIWAGVILPILGFAAAIVLLWGRAVRPVDLALLAFFYLFTGFGISVGFHRLFTHRAFETTRPIAFLLGVGGSMAVQNPLFLWCAIHRTHHHHADKEGDPHSPWLHGDSWIDRLRGLLFAHVGWLFHKLPRVARRTIADLEADPMFRTIDRLYPLWILLGLLIPAAIGGLVSMSWTGALLGLIWGGLARVFLMHHVTWSINSVCHMFGYRNFRSPDRSGNVRLFAWLGFGEGLHNNHHAFLRSARFAYRRGELDPGWLLIRTLQKLGLAWDVILPTERQVEARRVDAPRRKPA